MSRFDQNRPQAPAGGMVSLFGPLTYMVKILLIINFAVYLVELVVINWTGSRLLGELRRQLTLIPSDVFNKFHLWQVITYSVLHDPASPMHILLNMFMLWIFGSPLEQRWGPKRFLIFYLACCLAGGVMTVLVSVLVLAVKVPNDWFLYAIVNPDIPHLGASGGIFGLTAAFALLWRDAQIYLFFILPVKAKWLIPLELAGEALMFLAKQPVSYTAHLGGLLCGILMVTGYWRPRYWLDSYRLWRIRQQHKKKPKSHLEIVKGKDRNGRYLH